MGFTEKDERFYYDINSHSIDILVDKILSGNSNYTLDIYKDKGLMSDALNRVEQEINHRKSNDLLKEDEIGRLKNDEFLKNKAKQDVITFCNEIEDGIWSLDEIKVKILNAVVSYDDIAKYYSESNLTSDNFGKITYYLKSKKNVDFYLWKDLPPLLNDRTDIYFFGQPASGKSCILANLFSYINNEGLIIENTHSLIGTRYKNAIQHEMDLGFLPQSTIADKDGVNYIPFDLIEDSEMLGRKHPLNFIEMSGELFNDAAEGGVSVDNLNAKNFLDNNNRKLLFFVIDYDMHVQKAKNPDGETPQGAKMLTILSLLDQFGTFRKTDGIYILVAKADLFPQGVDSLQFASDFLNVNYKSFLNNCKEIKKKYRSELGIKAYPYSIGSLSMKSSFVYQKDYTWAKKIVKEIIDNSHGTGGQGRGVFGFFRGS